MRSGDKYFQGHIRGGGLEANTTVTFTSSMSASDIQALIDAQPKYIPYGKTLTFQFADGTYTLSDNIYFEGFHGAGWVYVQGNDSEDPNSLHTNQAVHLNFSGTETFGLQFFGNTAYMLIDNLKITVKTTAQNNVAIYALVGSNYQIRGCYLLGTDTSYGTSAYFGTGSIGHIRDTYVSNILTGIASVDSRVFSQGNDDTGTQPAYGLRSINAGTIGKSTGSQPSGSTSNEYTTNGGVIR